MSRVDMKVVLLGKEYGGKTSLVERYVYDRFSGCSVYQNTIGAAYVAKPVEINNRQIILGIWDTAGSERYEAMSKMYYRDAKAAIVCYDLTDGSSFERAKFWVNELKKHEESCKIYLCGTKKDLIRENRNARSVDYHTTTDYADEINTKIYETSSKSGEGVQELFLDIAMEFSKQKEVLRENDTFSLKEKKASQWNCCN
ncbi:ras-related protein Rab-24-like [Centruroides vittatus]|uniref:ras-related protein Rab-24-like n=1 Tax=Centruroides vittatus TaxID=120091 RepID=UPI003510B03F